MGLLILYMWGKRNQKKILVIWSLSIKHFPSTLTVFDTAQSITAVNTESASPGPFGVLRSVGSEHRLRSATVWSRMKVSVKMRAQQSPTFPFRPCKNVKALAAVFYGCLVMDVLRVPQVACLIWLHKVACRCRGCDWEVGINFSINTEFHGSWFVHRRLHSVILNPAVQLV